MGHLLVDDAQKVVMTKLCEVDAFFCSKTLKLEPNRLFSDQIGCSGDVCFVTVRLNTWEIEINLKHSKITICTDLMVTGSSRPPPPWKPVPRLAEKESSACPGSSMASSSRAI